MGYKLKKGAAAGRYCSDGCAHTFAKGKTYQLNEAQAKAFAAVVESNHAGKGAKGKK